MRALASHFVQKIRFPSSSRILSLLTAIIGATIISASSVPSAQALSFAPGTKFLPYKTKNACHRNGGNWVRWQNERYCVRQKRPNRPRVTNYRSCVKAGGKILKSRPPLCLWNGRYYTKKVAKPKPVYKPNPAPIVIRTFRDCRAYGGRIRNGYQRSCTILGRTFYKQPKYRPVPNRY